MGGGMGKSFFSSRRRHTRYWRDWSSDVCSSDLKPRSPRGTGPVALVAVAVLFALSAILDPTFVSLVVLAGRGEAFWSVVAAHSVWVAVSQAPLILLLAAVAGGKHGRFVARFGFLWERVRPAVGRLVTAAALLVGAFFVLDAGWWFATGEFLVTV